MVCSCIFLIQSFAFGQTEQIIIKKKRSAVRAELRDISISLSATSDKIESLEIKLALSQERSTLVDSLSSLTRRELDFLGARMLKTSDLIEKLSARKQQLEGEHIKIYKAAYRHHHSTNMLITLLSASSLSDAMLRWRFLRNIEELRSRRHKRVIHASAQLHTAQNTLEQQLQEEKQSIVELDSLQAELLQSIREEQSLLRKAKRESKKLKKLKRTRQKEDRALKKELEDVIAALNYTAPVPKTETAENNASKSSGIFLKPVPGDFISKKYIAREKTSTFFSPIRTGDRQEVRAAKSGTVKKISFKKLKQNIVVIDHDGTPYFSMYAQLGSVNISVGDAVQQGDIIGTVHEANLLFAICKRTRNGKHKRLSIRQMKKLMR